MCGLTCGLNPFKPSYVRSADAVGAVRRSARGRRRRPWPVGELQFGGLVRPLGQPAQPKNPEVDRLSDFLVSYSMHKVRNRCLTDLHRTLP